jgi:hypothetical protein
MIAALTPAPTLLERIRFHFFMRKWRRTPIGRLLTAHTNKYFYGPTASLRFFSQKDKEKLIGEFYQRIFAFPNASNPFLAFREDIANVVTGYASLQVLCLKPEEKAQSYYAQARYISADLHHHIRACAAHNEELKEILWQNPQFTDEDIVSAVNTRCAVYLHAVNGLNILRSEFGESLDKGKDWFRPFIVSAMIFQEETYRRKIGLPSLLPRSDDIVALEHSTFFTGVVEGERNPLYGWETHYGRVHALSI